MNNDDRYRLIIQNGFMDMLKYFHEKGYEYDEIACCYAAENNNLEMLKYLREKGYKLGESVCSRAA